MPLLLSTCITDFSIFWYPLVKDLSAFILLLTAILLSYLLYVFGQQHIIFTVQLCIKRRIIEDSLGIYANATKVKFKFSQNG